MTDPDFADTLRSVGGLLASLGATGPSRDGSDQPGEVGQADEGQAAPAHVEGVSPSGLVRTVVGLGGRVESVAIEPRGMRLDSQTLGAEVAASVNSALDELRAQVTALAPGGLDTSGLQQSLRELQETSAQQFTSFLDQIRTAQERILSREQ